ncbi:MAG: hypothetical protein JWO57_2863 [Pseudonocardiales bacterium]|nr:hypothetical protein [Pseudonocardiales bacterium]
MRIRPLGYALSLLTLGVIATGQLPSFGSSGAALSGASPTTRAAHPAGRSSTAPASSSAAMPSPQATTSQAAAPVSAVPTTAAASTSAAPAGTSSAAQAPSRVESRAQVQGSAGQPVASIDATSGGISGAHGAVGGSDLQTKASSAATLCGATIIAKPTGGTWQCTFDDEFSGTTLNRSKWTVQRTADSGFHSGPECMVDSTKNVSVSGGYLNLTVRRETAPFTCTDPYGNYTTQYTSASVSTWGAFSQAYGRFAVRAKFPAATVAGLQSSLWLWPQDQNKYGAWPKSGEIDIAESYSQYPDLAIPFIHYDAAPAPLNATANTNLVTKYDCRISDPTKFHEYVAEWTQHTITIKYDGSTCLVNNWVPAAPLASPAPFNQPFLVALTQALGVDTNAFKASSTPLPATTQVDYVRVWK